MVQGYTQQDCGGKSGWTSHLGSRRAEEGKLFSRTIFYSNEAFWCSYFLVELRMTNGLHISQKNLSYQELKRLIEKLDGLC